MPKINTGRKGKKCGNSYISAKATCRQGRSGEREGRRVSKRAIAIGAAALGSAALGTYAIRRTRKKSSIKGLLSGSSSLNTDPWLGEGPGENPNPWGGKLNKSSKRSISISDPWGSGLKTSNKSSNISVGGNRIVRQTPKSLESTNFKTVNVPTRVVSEKRSMPGGLVGRAKRGLARGFGRHNKAMRGAGQLLRYGPIDKQRRLSGIRRAPKILTSAEQRERDYWARKRAEYVQEGRKREAEFAKDLGQMGKEIGEGVRGAFRWWRGLSKKRKDSFHYDYDNLIRIDMPRSTGQKGKKCGNSYISARATCKKGRGLKQKLKKAGSKAARGAKIASEHALRTSGKAIQVGGALRGYSNPNLVEGMFQSSRSLATGNRLIEAANKSRTRRHRKEGRLRRKDSVWAPGWYD